MRALVFLLITGLGMGCSAQSRNNNWVFPRYLGLDFSFSPPIYIPNTQIQTSDQSASISSTNGVLLFYTDRDTIWNNLHEVMLNGTGLMGNGPVQSLIVPHPGNPNLYYVFTTDIYNPNQTSIGEMGYSLVDMNEDGGLGSVVQKNDTLATEHIAPKVAATLHQNGQNYWVIFHEIWTNAFRAYLITSSGLQQAPIISNGGSIYWPALGVGDGQMKFSMDGGMLATGYIQQNLLQLFHFDVSTGLVTDAIEITIPCSSSDCPKGLEFSEDGTKLYFTTSQLPSSTWLYQMDISVWDSLIIHNSVQIIDSLPLNSGIGQWGQLELAPDGKIYMLRWGEDHIGVINNPNNSGTACNFVLDGLSIPQISVGLPSQIKIYHDDDVGILETPPNPGLQLYPNPTSNQLTLQLAPQWASKKLELQWHDARGRLLKSAFFNYAPQLELEMQQFETGFYLLALYGDGELLGRESVVVN